MKRTRTLSAIRSPIQAHDVVRELCETIDAAARGEISQAGSTIRGAVTLGAKLLATGAIDDRGARLISAAAAKANRATRARALVLVGTPEPVLNRRRINLSMSIASPTDQASSAEDKQFEALLDVLIGERTHL